jgi:tetratricopeptide (TPR) repeat protein
MRFIKADRLASVFAVLLAAFVIFCQTAAAQDKPQQEQPKVSKDEANLAKKLQEGSDVAAKMKLTEKFIKEFPNSSIREQVARYIAGQIGTVSDANQKSALLDSYAKVFTKPAEADYVAPLQIEGFTKLKRYDEAFKLGGEYLSRVSGDLLIRLHLVIEGSNLARAGNNKYSAQTRDFALKAIEIIESGKKPTEMTDADWALAQTGWLAQFYQSLGFLESAAGNNSEALKNFEKAAKIDGKDVNNWAMMGFITNQNYQDLAQKYTLASGSEQAELRKKAEAELDKVIELYARVVAMTEGVAAQANLNSQVRGDLENYYKYRHNNSTDGLQALIDKYKTK